jgi:hypothetical protein
MEQTNTIIDGNNTSRVFNITAGDITFNGVTIRNGNTTGDGGGIFADGNVTLNNSTVMGNTSRFPGRGDFRSWQPHPEQFHCVRE